MDFIRVFYKTTNLSGNLLKIQHDFKSDLQTDFYLRPSIMSGWQKKPRSGSSFRSNQNSFCQNFAFFLESVREASQSKQRIFGIKQKNNQDTHTYENTEPIQVSRI